jgi:hypothetical protein
VLGGRLGFIGASVPDEGFAGRKLRLFSGIASQASIALASAA